MALNLKRKRGEEAVIGNPKVSIFCLQSAQFICSPLSRGDKYSLVRTMIETPASAKSTKKRIFEEARVNPVARKMRFGKVLVAKRIIQRVMVQSIKPDRLS